MFVIESEQVASSKKMAGLSRRSQRRKMKVWGSSFGLRMGTFRNTSGRKSGSTLRPTTLTISTLLDASKERSERNAVCIHPSSIFSQKSD